MYACLPLPDQAPQNADSTPRLLQYISEWIEWSGYVIAGGGFFNFLPATLFLVNELATMLPR